MSDAAQQDAPRRRPLPVWAAAVLAALVAVLAGLPGLLAAPPLDRDEARFAQATAQMLETRDFVRIRFLDEPRDKKPVGIHWLQAASVAALSSAEARDIRPYRLPSLLGAAIAAAACAWGAAAFWGARCGLVAGALLGAGAILSTEAGIAKTDAVLCAAVTLSMAALGRIYAAWREAQPDAAAPKASRPLTGLFWLGIAVALIVKGPVGPLVVGLAGLMLWALDRRADWARQLRWGWGVVVILAVVGPWALAITVATDGAFWGAAIGGDLAPKLTGGHESHGAPPGVHTLLAPLLLFPGSLLLPAALVVAWRGRNEPGVRFATAWLIPTWLLFELLPTKLAHYTLPAYGALAWLAAAGLARPLGRWVRASGAALSVLAGAVFAAVAVYAATEFGDADDLAIAAFTAAVLGAAGLLGAVALVRARPARWLAAVLALGVLAHGLMLGVLAPRLESLWPARTLALAAREAGLPRGEVAATGFAEPSLVFLLGTRTRLTTPEGAAERVAAGRPAVVEAAERPAFEAALTRRGVTPEPVREITAFNYSRGDPVQLTLYRGRRQEAR